MTHTPPFSKLAGRWWNAFALLMPSRPQPMIVAQPEPVKWRIRTRAMGIGEEAVLAELFVSSVRELGVPAYSPEQVRIWSSFGTHFAEFQARLQGGQVVVAEDESVAGRIIGFGQLENDAHLSLLYTCPQAVRQGVATRVFEELESVARLQGARRIHTEASHVSRPFFAKQGFTLIGLETVERGGVAFERFKMEKSLVRSD